jgi:Flp pilus assembly protein TadG
VVEFVLVIALLVPMFLGILQLALVLMVRNTLASAAAEGARLAATYDHDLADGRAKTREQIAGAISGRFADDIEIRNVTVDGRPTVEVIVHASVPALGLGGPGIGLDVSGHAVEERTP